MTITDYERLLDVLSALGVEHIPFPEGTHSTINIGCVELLFDDTGKYATRACAHQACAESTSFCSGNLRGAAHIMLLALKAAYAMRLARASEGLHTAAKGLAYALVEEGVLTEGAVEDLLSESAKALDNFSASFLRFAE